jgi:hypothetical protein
MIATHEPRRGAQHIVAVPAELRWNLAVDEGQNIAVSLVNAEMPWRTVETGMLEVLEQRRGQRIARLTRPPYRCADPNHAGRHAPAGEKCFARHLYKPNAIFAAMPSAAMITIVWINPRCNPNTSAAAMPASTAAVRSRPSTANQRSGPACISVTW